MCWKCRHLYILLVCLHIFVKDLEGSVLHHSGQKYQKQFKGRYTRDVSDYEVVIPRKVNDDGSFASFKLPHHYDRDETSSKRKRRDVSSNKKLHYIVNFDGKSHHLELLPNEDFMSPGLVIETRQVSQTKDLGKAKLRFIRKPQCHFTGWVRGQNGSRAALSACDGLVGYIKTSSGHFFVEPALDAVVQNDGRHLHLVYRHVDKDEKSTNPLKKSNCGVDNDWQSAWRERIKSVYGRDLKLHELQKKRSASKHRFIETCVVADRMFLDHHNNTDVETYILTIMNMVSDFYHDESIGNMIDFVVVRIIFLEKEHEEMNMGISKNAEKTLTNFCDWQKKVNPKNISHPNHHDIGILLTRYDLCWDNMTSCGLLGLAYMATACEPKRSCAINEDTGLALSVVVAHEVGHVMGCPHDEELTGCQPLAEDLTNNVMSPFVRFDTSRWSPCSRRFITEYLDGGLGECLLNEPCDHNFKMPDMPAGAMYDATYQCEMLFGPGTVPCRTGTDTFCEKLWCQTKPNSCSSYDEPPADGTSCGTNMWCYDKKCVEIGKRPDAVDGEWSEWGPWGDCSRTCGGGVSYRERECDHPPPSNRGRYCLGRRKMYQTCNTAPCNETSPRYRAVQCSEFNAKKFRSAVHTWKPFTPREPHNPCSLFCVHEGAVYSELAPRVRDGTSCHPGTRDLCIGGVCTHVGCDWVIDSDAIDDQCGQCRGDGTQCTLVEDTYNATASSGYVNITTIPKGVRNLKVEELKPSENILAVSSLPKCEDAAEKPTFYLNGNNEEFGDGEYMFGNTVGYYSHPEVDREELEIGGPTTEDLVIWIVFYGKSNPGIWYKYYEPAANSSYLPKYNWEFLEWGECSARCAGGSEIAEPSCVESRTGKVSNSFCHPSDKPQSKSRVCNTQPCKTRWKIGTWGPCTGVKGKSFEKRKVTCVKESPHVDEEDEEVEPIECKKEKRPKSSRTCELPSSCDKTKKKKCTEEHDDVNIMEAVANGVDEAESRRSPLTDDGESSEFVTKSDKPGEEKCTEPPKNDKCSAYKVQPGKEVEDRQPPANITLMEAKMVPRKLTKKVKSGCPKGNNATGELSDQGEQELGDKIPELTLNLKCKKVYHGAQAVSKINEMVNPGCKAHKKPKSDLCTKAKSCSKGSK